MSCTTMEFIITRTRWAMSSLSLFSLAMINMSYAGEKFLTTDDKKITSIEYLAPTETSRDIKTTNIDINHFLTAVEKMNLSIYWGFTATYATGSITQLEGSLEDGTLREVQYDNSAFGIGPGLTARFRVWNSNKFSFYLSGSGNFIVYNKKFPAGGDYYNFMWRGGPALEYVIEKSKAAGIDFHWAHVSNGQGVGPENPSYEARGLMLRFSGFF